MTCDRERLTAYVDGALDAKVCPEIEAHLAECDECRAQAEEERALRARLRALPPVEPPPELEQRVRRSLRSRPRVPWLLPVAAALAALIAWGRGAPPFVAWELSRDHDHCFGRRRLPAQVWSSDAGYVAQWFESRGTRVPLIPEAAGGLELAGARFCPLLDRSVGHLYYTNGEHRLSLFVVPGPVREASREMRPRGNFVRLMRVGGSTLALVSEEESAVEAFEHALSTTVARGSAKLAEVDPASP